MQELGSPCMTMEVGKGGECVGAKMGQRLTFLVLSEMIRTTLGFPLDLCREEWL